MQSIFLAACGTLFTFFMTALGASLVFIFRRPVSSGMQRACIGFAAGVMAAASVFSLLVPAIRQQQLAGGTPALTVCAGFLSGAALMLVIDALLARRQQAADEAARKQRLMLCAVTLHNIPEGMAVGLAFALAPHSGAAGLASAAALALGIGIQNIPEGAAVALPLRQSGMSRARSFSLGAASGIVEPIFGLLVILAANAFAPIMPLLMAFAAGTMMFVVIADMIPDAAQSRSGVLMALAGYVVMMALDVALG